MKSRYSFAKMATPLVVLVALFGFSRVSLADPVNVSFADSVAMNDSASDFLAMNNLDGTNGISFFGATSPVSYIAGLAGGWGYAAGDNPGTNANLGGSGTVDGNIADGVAPVSGDWFAVAYGGVDNGSGRFASPSNPGFEGVSSAGASVMPAPTTLMLLGIGLVGLAGTIRSRLRTASHL